jgi:hypothetical protein
MAVNHHRPSGGMRPSTKAQGWTRGRAVFTTEAAPLSTQARR